MIKFISYTGKWPTLCSGTLTVEIDGKEIKFGHEPLAAYNYETDSYDDDPDHTHLAKFWCSGGGLNRDYEPYEDDWELDPYYIREANYPEEIEKLLPELLKVFNENVEHGCCGGCS